jgi:hypothetical protein
MKTVISQKNVDHPLDDIFDIVPSGTVVEYTTIVPAVLAEMPNYDNKDNEIETKLEEIYATAMQTVLDMTDAMETVEGKYKARVGEVSATMLSVALGAVNAKTHLKIHKDKLQREPAAGGPHTVNNNLVITDRNEILRMLQTKNK